MRKKSPLPNIKRHFYIVHFLIDQKLLDHTSHDNNLKLADSEVVPQTGIVQPVSLESGLLGSDLVIDQAIVVDYVIMHAHMVNF